MNMDENNKVTIFEKKEIILILIFVVVLIITSFTLGIRLGKKLALNESGIKEEDVKAVELKSTAEEDVEAAVAEDSKLTDEEKLKKLMDESKARLSDELQKFSSEEATKTETAKTEAPQSSMVGKYTIQLGSYNTLDEAKQFAEGFTVRGYNPIINEVKIEGKGTWYRVSLGVFTTVEEAKSYIKQEQSLFSGQDHVISKID
jgi:septal ring-binding cell division protein DamX